MICDDCKSKKCPRCLGLGQVVAPTEEIMPGGTELVGGLVIVSAPVVIPESMVTCPECNGSGLLKEPDHEECKRKNKGRTPSDCDCQHRSIGPEAGVLLAG